MNPRVIWEGSLYGQGRGPTVRLVLTPDEEARTPTIDVECARTDAMGGRAWGRFLGDDKTRASDERDVFKAAVLALVASPATEPITRAGALLVYEHRSRLRGIARGAGHLDLPSSLVEADILTADESGLAKLTPKGRRLLEANDAFDFDMGIE